MILQVSSSISTLLTTLYSTPSPSALKKIIIAGYPPSYAELNQSCIPKIPGVVCPWLGRNWGVIMMRVRAPQRLSGPGTGTGPRVCGYLPMQGVRIVT